MTKKMYAEGGYDFGSNRLQSVGNGTAATDAVNKGQLDTAIAGAGGGVGKHAVTGPPVTGMTWTITHPLSTDDVSVTLRELATKEFVDVLPAATDANTVTIQSTVPLTQNGYRAVI